MSTKSNSNEIYIRSIICNYQKKTNLNWTMNDFAHTHTNTNTHSITYSHIKIKLKQKDQVSSNFLTYAIQYLIYKFFDET